MILSLIVAMDESGGIGHHGRLPWRLAADLKRFKRITMGHAIIMGRKTYESIGKALPGREMIVVSRNLAYQAEGCRVVNTFEAALEAVAASGEQEVFVIGGSEIFAEALPRADRIYLTLVHTQAPADVFFPEFDRSEWEIAISTWVRPDQDNQFPHTFMVMNKKDGVQPADQEKDK